MKKYKHSNCSETSKPQASGIGPVLIRHQVAAILELNRVLSEFWPTEFSTKTAELAIWCGLVAVSHWAQALGLTVDLLPVPEDKSDTPWSPNKLRPLFEYFGRLNSQVWIAEQIFEDESESNKPFRNLGRAMHALYEAMKYEMRLLGGDYWQDPYFPTIFVECMERANAGEAIAQKYMYDHWGVCLGEFAWGNNLL